MSSVRPWANWTSTCMNGSSRDPNFDFVRRTPLPTALTRPVRWVRNVTMRSASPSFWVRSTTPSSRYRFTTPLCRRAPTVPLRLAGRRRPSRLCRAASRSGGRRLRALEEVGQRTRHLGGTVAPVVDDAGARDEVVQSTVVALHEDQQEAHREEQDAERHRDGADEDSAHRGGAAVGAHHPQSGERLPTGPTGDHETPEYVDECPDGQRDDTPGPA